LLLVTAAGSWTLAGTAYGGLAGLLAVVGLIGGLVAALVTIFKKEWSSVSAPVYAVCEGLVLGAVSALFEQWYPGLVVNAILLTVGVFFALLFAYKNEWIRPTKKFVLGLMIAMAGIFIMYIVDLIMGFFGHSIGFIHDSGPIGIAFSVVVVIVAALNLILDFALIEQGAKEHAPRYMEWYGAFSLLVTLVWLYLEILRLLAKVRGGRD
jgi:uncharacterized YccA/Bax inhibitor family protein